MSSTDAPHTVPHGPEISNYSPASESPRKRKQRLQRLKKTGASAARASPADGPSPKRKSRGKAAAGAVGGPSTPDKKASVGNAFAPPTPPRKTKTNNADGSPGTVLKKIKSAPAAKKASSAFATVTGCPRPNTPDETTNAEPVRDEADCLEHPKKTKTSAAETGKLVQSQPEAVTHVLSDFNRVALFGLLPILTVRIVAGGEATISIKGHHFIQMLIADDGGYTRRMLGLGKAACAVLKTVQTGMIVRFEKLKATRGRSTSAVAEVEFHVTDSNIKVFSLKVLSENSAPPAFHYLAHIVPVNGGTIVNVKVVIHTVQANDTTLKLLCYDQNASILLTFTGTVKARMMRFLSSTCSFPMTSTSDNWGRPVIHCKHSQNPIGCPVILRNVQVAIAGGRHLRATGLTLFDAWTNEDDDISDLEDEHQRQELTLAAMHEPLHPTADHLAADPLHLLTQSVTLRTGRPSSLLDVHNSQDNAKGPDYFVVCAGLSSVNIGKTRQGGVSIGLKLEDHSFSLWANSYGDALAASLGLDAGQFNVLADSGELRTHIEARFPGPTSPPFA